MTLPIFIAARIGSTRLTNKHLREVFYGKPAISCFIERLKETNLELILCTPEGVDEEPLHIIADSYGIGIFAGDDENVLLRFLQALEYMKINTAIMVDADDAFVSIEAILKIHEKFKNHDLIHYTGMPYGGSPYLLSRDLISILVKENFSSFLQYDFAHDYWRSYIKKIPKKKLLIKPQDYLYSEKERSYRFSLDYKNDLEYIRYLYKECVENGNSSFNEIVHYVTSNYDYLFKRFPDIFNNNLMEKGRVHRE